MAANSNISTSKKTTSTYRSGPRFSKEQRKEVQKKFLKSFAANGNVRAACMAAGIERTTVHYWSEHDEEFSMQYNLAKEDVNDTIRAEIFKRAVIGEERFVTSVGKVVYHEGKPLTIREKSDTLLMFHAKSRMPEYRDKAAIINNILPKEYINVPEDGSEE
jgi:hypothetical protein